MYLPEHFSETRLDVLHDVIAEHPFGLLTRLGPDGLDADHLPFLLERGAGSMGTLQGHVARANPLWREARDGDPVLVVFQAGDSYVSPNWYPSKHDTHRQVPTWNYRVVHVHGRIVIRDDVRFLRGLVGRLTRVHEHRAGEVRPWRMADAAPGFIDELLAAIVGIEIVIERMVGKWKLGQNKTAGDRLGAAQAIAAHGQTALAEAMTPTGESG